MQNGLASLAVVTATLFLGCPSIPLPGNNGSSSSSSSSGGASSSSGAAVVPGQPIPLENLCPSLASGYLRMYAFYVSSLGLAGGSKTGCEPALSDEDLLTAFFGDADLARGDLCSADGGMMALNVDAVAKAQREGRLVYDPIAAGNCLAQGRRTFALYGGLLRAVLSNPATVDAGDQEQESACNRVIQGLQGEGRPCLSPLECAPLDAGVGCVHRLQADCLGVCQRLGLAGEECSTRGNPDCSGTFTCLKPGDQRHGICAATALVGQACAVDGGVLGCLGGGKCTNGLCTAYRDGGTTTEGTGCGDTEECVAGLVCTGSPSRCQRKGVLGEVCNNGSSIDKPCDPCLVCYTLPGQDAGPDAGLIHKCTAAAGLDGNCAAAPCEFGLVCLGGACKPLAREGQACARADDTTAEHDTSVGANCLSSAHACVGSPAACQLRAAPGSPCVAPPVTLPVQGSCKSGLTCVRPSATATGGTCQSNPNQPSRPCGQTWDLASDCDQTQAGAALLCSSTWDGGRGVCVLDGEGVTEDPCVDRYGCAQGYYCAGADGGVTPGHCAAGGQVGDPCGYDVDAGWKEVCQEGFCLNQACHAPLAVGAPCVGPTQCAGNLWCNEDAGCQARLLTGAPCVVDEQCAQDLACAPEGVCAAAECVNYDGGCGGCGGGCKDGTYVPTLLFFGAVTHAHRRRPRQAA